MNKKIKILISGVGGQGVVYLTDLIVEAALLADIRINASEIHGLTQRGGSVISGITLGDNSFGFIGKAGVDVLLGLEALEAQRCLDYLHAGSIAVVDSHRILPNSVHSGIATYPDTQEFINYLSSQIKKTILIPKELPFKPVYRNLYVLGKYSLEPECPFSRDQLEQAIRNKARPELVNQSLDIFQMAIESKLI